ncbi:MAG: hypothetical protein AAB834_01820 [Patescibacteria group bacterium]
MSFELQLLSGVFFILGGVVGVVLMVMPVAAKSHGSGRPGIVTVGRHKYPYEMGDQLFRYGGQAGFSGMDILLPKRLPHVFIDARANGKGLRSDYVFESDARIPLEGNFGHSFKAYASKQHKALALSILDSEVLGFLTKHAHRFDVEIMNYHVRLIVPGQMVSRNDQLQHELLTVAKAIMKKVDHRLKSWEESSLTGDMSSSTHSMDEHLRLR